MNLRHLAVLAYAQGFTLYVYRSDEPLRHITSKGYFNNADTTLKTGDMILVTARDGGTMRLVTSTTPGYDTIPGTVTTSPLS